MLLDTIKFIGALLLAVFFGYLVHLADGPSWAVSMTSLLTFMIANLHGDLIIGGKL